MKLEADNLDFAELLLDNESFDDMMAILRQPGRNRRFRAFLILKQLVLMYKRELSHNAERLELLTERVTHWHNASECSQAKDQISRLDFTIEGISKYKETLLDFLNTTARRSNVGSRDWIWKPGQKIPNRPTPLPIFAQDVSKLFHIPPVK